MAKQDMNLMVENFFAKKENLLSESFLEKLVRSEYKRVIREAVDDKGNITPKTLKFDYNSIPEIPVSEIAWSALETKETGESVSDPQRARLEAYLANIKGNSIEEKISGINKFYKANMEELEQLGIISADSRTSKIQKVISYLVFLKTLTTIITNFNAASAGFSFESFLGVLLGGKQIATGGKTIADLQTGNGEHISLKLLQIFLNKV